MSVQRSTPCSHAHPRPRVYCIKEQCTGRREGWSLLCHVPPAPAVDQLISEACEPDGDGLINYSGECTLQCVGYLEHMPQVHAPLLQCLWTTSRRSTRRYSRVGADRCAHTTCHSFLHARDPFPPPRAACHVLMLLSLIIAKIAKHS